MIRINLLPVRQVRKVQAGQRQLVLFVLLFVAEILGMFFLYNMQTDEIDATRRTVVALQNDINALKKDVGDYGRLQQQRQRLIAQRNIINQLNKQRIGPVWLLRELSGLLSSRGRPTVSEKRYSDIVRRRPNMRLNTNWNPRRLWLEQVNERNHDISLTGKAKDFDDLAEFHKRLILSDYFVDVKLRRNDQVLDTGLGIKVVRFSITARARY